MVEKEGVNRDEWELWIGGGSNFVTPTEIIGRTIKDIRIIEFSVSQEGLLVSRIKIYFEEMKS